MKELLLTVLDVWRRRLLNDECTMQELRSGYDAVVKNLTVDATIKDLADYYGQSESNVRNVASRHLIPKPKRRVLYDVRAFAKYIPKSWIN